ncbi:MAG TPA: ligase-associated DNA damage response DEXH box helicase, partial [Chitinophagales bacterium]|nr:ligase-associated DNA damage response DEXH box helicase [Chitinophagales bacterium]
MKPPKITPGEQVIADWMQALEWKSFEFQRDAWRNYLQGNSGLLNAPTGFGKTFALYLPVLMEWINQHPKDWQTKKQNGLQLLWITPLRALAKDLQRAMQEVCDAISLPWEIGMRSGDTSTSERAKQKKRLPEVLIITPESLHLLLAQKEYPKVFSTLQTVVADEWHELLGTKRGVQVELALSRLKGLRAAQPGGLRIWAISATIGNMKEAMEVMLGSDAPKGIIVKANLHKKIEIESILPDSIEKFPWAGHLGTRMVDKVIPIIEQSKTTLLFTNTRGQSELWFHTLLNAHPELAGIIALHHGSISGEVREWVENALHEGTLKVVVCTSSLDLGVDFRPVDTVIQVGSPKGVARFLQRAGRSGHSPDAVSKIYMLPTHSLELAEAAALKTAVRESIIEQRQPIVNAYDVLLQYLCTLAVGEGFRRKETLDEIRTTYAFKELTDDEWQWILNFITTGGSSLGSYDEYRKVEITDGLYQINNRKLAMRHRMSIGTIVGESMIRVKFMKGGYIGSMEESFISKLKPGDVFSLAGRNVEYVMIKDMDVLVRKSKNKKAIIASWNGGRMPLSSDLGEVLRRTYASANHVGKVKAVVESEIEELKPLFDLQAERSHVPDENETLVEYIETKDGHHLFIYPFEGRLVHEVMASLLAYRLSLIKPLTFSIAMNDYGFELLCDQPIPVDNKILQQLFSTDDLIADIQKSVNATEMARRKFRGIAVIAGLVFRGYPGAGVKSKHLQSSSSLLFTVFNEYDEKNLLLKQAYNEAFNDQIEEV